MKLNSLALIACFIFTIISTPVPSNYQQFSNSSHLTKRDLQTDFINFGLGNVAFTVAGQAQYLVSNSMFNTISAFTTTENVALQALLKAGSIAANLGMSLVFGLGAGLILGFVASLFGRPSAPSAYDIYSKIKGYIQAQIQTTIAVHDQAQAFDAIGSKMDVVNDHLSTLGNYDPCTDEVAMITTLTQLLGELTVPNDLWLRNPGGNDTFLLCSPQGHLSTSCLHTNGFLVQDNVDLVVDSGLNINSIPLQGMAFTTKNGNLQLVDSLSGGLYNLDFNQNSDNGALVARTNFEIASSCSLNQNPDGSYAISVATDGSKKVFTTEDDYDYMLPTNNQMCIWNGEGFSSDYYEPITSRKRDEFPQNLVSSDYSNSIGGNLDASLSDIESYPGCQEGGLNFARKLIIPTNGVGQFISFGEIGLELMAVPFLSSVHLSTLFELYHRDDPGNQMAYKANFDTAVQTYKDYLDYYVPIFKDYASVLNENFTSVIDLNLKMRAALNNATLEYSQPITFQIDNAIQTEQKIDPANVCAGPIKPKTTAMPTKTSAASAASATKIQNPKEDDKKLENKKL